MRRGRRPIPRKNPLPGESFAVASGDATLFLAQNDMDMGKTLRYLEKTFHG